MATDKAAVLAYVRVRDNTGQWIGCECCFTIVYDVMIVCTSIYKRGMKSQSEYTSIAEDTIAADIGPERALEAPVVRRIFSSSPKDPRYHMLSHISAKFSQPSKPQLHEPRAALFLNRFTRTLSIMYATSGIQDILGIPAEEMRGRSFYYCIAENCLQDAVKCLENAKGNDSIAYLRFWFRDPRQDDPPPPMDDGSDEEMTTDTSVDIEEGGVGIRSRSGTESNAEDSADSMDIDDETKPESRNSSNDSTNGVDSHEAIFGECKAADSSASSLGQSPNDESRSPRPQAPDPIEIEAVISCTSDGLVVCMRKARPMIPHPTHRPSKPVYQNGLFAAPWATEPILPPLESRPGAGFGTSFAPSLGPHGAQHTSILPSRAVAAATDQSGFMSAIRDQAIFAWALTGINGSLAEFGKGKPLGESLPQDGLPVWASDPRPSPHGENSKNGYHNDQERLSPENGRHRVHLFGDPGLNRDGSRSASNSNGNSNGSSGGGTPYPGPR